MMYYVLLAYAIPIFVFVVLSSLVQAVILYFVGKILKVNGLKLKFFTCFKISFVSSVLATLALCVSPYLSALVYIVASAFLIKRKFDLSISKAIGVFLMALVANAAGLIVLGYVAYSLYVGGECLSCAPTDIPTEVNSGEMTETIPVTDQSATSEISN